MSEKTDRDKIVEKIKKFLAMTVERGASEQEAMMAAKRAAQLMQEFDLSLSDLAALSKTKGKMEKFHFSREMQRFMNNLTTGISKLCSVLTLVTGPSDDHIEFVGHPIDVEFAQYLSAICLRALETQAERSNREYALFRLNVRRRKIESVLQGMSERINTRLKDLAWARREAQGTALMEVKEDIANRTLEEHGFLLSSTPRRERGVDSEAYTVGLALGEQVQLNAAVHGAAAADMADVLRDEEIDENILLLTSDEDKDEDEEEEDDLETVSKND